MSRFPDPISLPKKVFSERAARRKEIIRSSLYGISLRGCIIFFEFMGVLLFGSSALLMDALASFADIAASVALIVSIKLADRPPDDDHPFGHGRYEPLAGLQLGMLMALLGLGMLVQQIFSVSTETVTTHINPLAWIFPFIAMVLLEIGYQLIKRTAKKQHSPALEADAIHYRVDGLTSLFATVVLAIGAFFPAWSHFLDHIGAILIAIFILGLGFYAARKNLHQLMDKVPEEQFFNKVRAAAQKVVGVQGTEKIRIQLYGPDAHVDIDIEVNPKLSVEIAHKISQKVRVEIQKAWPAVRDATVHIEPFYPNDH
jgi:cation diffusion facilitator family transporter